jgi:hypothetical protein
VIAGGGKFDVPGIEDALGRHDDHGADDETENQRMVHCANESCFEHERPSKVAGDELF